MSAALATSADARTGSATAPARTRPAARAATTAPPRLLLPPTAEPSHVARSASIGQPPVGRSVLSPLTSAAWPTAAPEPPREEPLEDPTRLCGAVVMAAIEALTSARPLVQLARWVSPEVYEALARAVRPGPATGRRGVVLRAVRLCRVGPTVAEGTAVVHDGARVRAAAVRLEVHRGSWRATVLQIG
ncbi:Rv3235 family protein [Actinotalea fermentans]|uniref:Uncharacterized protein n=1 Tax=Actinotalea fermentans TaxID=43671 RepID=A0A511YSZ5_9CELL|nr:Rv3235 family protein [Actinotalea fermentans]KGM15182.1 hypothetical protein N867_11070 [Actinotalea fermentans ATCC 43279 = JCM 9966 = DSM 3133]GEN78317.1 hypothetical protein AFE02nite_00510 [Actinotalea fermentans]